MEQMLNDSWLTLRTNSRLLSSLFRPPLLIRLDFESGDETSICDRFVTAFSAMKSVVIAIKWQLHEEWRSLLTWNYLQSKQWAANATTSPDKKGRRLM
jgi:hypothetical protein